MLQLSALRELHSGEASVKLQGTKWGDVACAGGSRVVERARLLWNLRGPSSHSHQKEGGFTKRRGSEENQGYHHRHGRRKPPGCGTEVLIALGLSVWGGRPGRSLTPTCSCPAVRPPPPPA